MKNLLLSVLATSLVLSASAAVPFEKGKTNSIPVRKTYRSAPSVSPPMSRAVEEKVLLDENFGSVPRQNRVRKLYMKMDTIYPLLTRLSRVGRGRACVLPEAVCRCIHGCPAMRRPVAGISPHRG